MSIKMVTLEREYGSGGSFIAEKLAARLGWKLWDTALTDEIARQAKIHPEIAAQKDEKRDPLLYRLFKVFARGSYERALPVDEVVFDTAKMVRLLFHVIEGAAAQGHCVIVGRGAPYILRSRPDAYHVFVFAPYEEKLRRLLGWGKTKVEAVEMLETIDKERAAFIKHYYGADWPYRYLYNLWINSAVGDEAVLEMILSGIEIANRHPAVNPPASCP